MKKKIIALALCVFWIQSIVIISAGPSRIISNERYKTFKQKMYDSRASLEIKKQAWKDAPSGEKFDKLKEHWEAIIELAKARLELLKTHIELSEYVDSDTKAEILSEIDDIYNRLDALIPKIDAMEDLGDALRIIADFLDIWKDFVWKAKKYFGLVVTAQIDKVIDKGEEIRDYMQSRIALLESEGKDVTELQRLYDDYSQRLETIKDKNSQAIAKLEEIDGWEGHKQLFLEATKLVAEERKEARYALNDLRRFVEELRDLGVVIGIGTGSLFAGGSGTADLSGDGKVVLQSISDPNGEITIWDYAGDASIDVDYNGDITTNPDASETYKKVVSATVEGSDIRVLISGDDYLLYARGTGQATLIGKGWYHFGNENNKINFDTETGKAVEISIIGADEVSNE